MDEPSERERTLSIGSDHGLDNDEDDYDDETKKKFDELRERVVSKELRKRLESTDLTEKLKAQLEQDSLIADEKAKNKAKLSFVFRYLLHENAQLKKLASHEDPYHLHKTLGILSVCSFVYRYGVMYNRTGTLGFNGTSFDWHTMGVHLFLAASSMIFRSIPLNRIADKPMNIYEEYRQHAIVFTARCYSVFAVAVLWSSWFPDKTMPVWFMPSVVAVHHLLADFVTYRHGDGNTAVRSNTDKLTDTSLFIRTVTKFYSFYQFLAIGSHILPNDRLPDLAYNAIIAIASSAFMMTLYKKRIIRGYTHLVVYSLCLLLSAFHIIRLVGYTNSGAILATFMLRINLPRDYSNKYVVWTLFLCFCHWDNLKVFIDNPSWEAAW